MKVKKRYISLYVENRIGVLAKISGLLAGKSYNLDTLTVGETEDPTVSRMTIGLTIDDVTFEQVKKQLNRCVVSSCSEKDKAEIFRIAQAFSLDVIDYDRKNVMVQCVKTESANNDMIALFNDIFVNRIEVVRGGSVAIEAISTRNQ